jgi:hypothetical protein
MGGIVRSLWIPGRVFHPFVNETVIVKAGSEALLGVPYILANGKGSRGAGFWSAAIGLVPGRYVGLVGRLLSGPVGGCSW